MTSPAKLGKYVEGSRSRGCLDRISGLPDELLVQILSSLPTRCVVSTSILSKRWRYLFTLTDSLSFDDAPCFAGSKGGNKDSKVARKQRFKEFVYNVLKMHRISPIEKFSLVCCVRYDNSDLNAWVSEAVQKGVVEIYYKVPRQKGTLPDALVRCETLGRLEIVCGDNELEIPSLAWLPNLKILHLKDVIINDYDSVKNLFSSCELLEELNLQSFLSVTHCHVIISTELLKVLTIKDCIFDEGLLEIDAPNLAYLTYDSNIGVKVVPSWKNSDSLVNAELTFKLSSEDDNFRFTSLLYRQLLKAAAYKVTQLNLLFDSVEPLLTLADREEMPDFHSLLTLRLHYCPYYAWPYFTRLLDKSPLLETVILERGLHRCHCDPVTIPDMPLIPFLSQVKVIILHSFCTHERARLLLAHLLRNARVLKRLILYSSCRVGTQEELQLRGDLLSLPRASADCSIELNNATTL